MSRGYIKLDRALENWRFKTKPNYVALWVELLLKANHQQQKYDDIVVNRGELITSYESLKKGTGLSLQTIRTIFNKLKDEEITIKSTNKYTLIHIVNYDKYQSSNNNTNKQNNKQKESKLTINQQTTNKQLTTNKNDNNVINIKNIDDEIINKYIEAGYSETLIEKCLYLMEKFNVSDKNSFIKILEVIDNNDIVNKEAYIYTMRERKDL